MEKINRGRLTISANILLTASLITRTFTLGFIMMLILIKVNNDILDEDVIKIVDMHILAGMPLGTTVKSIVFSFIGVFVLELVTGIFGIWGAIGRKKRILAVNVLMSSIMIVVYLIYIVNFSIIYDMKNNLKDTLSNYTLAYQASLSNTRYISYMYLEKTFPNYLKKLGCQNSDPERYQCGSVYVQKLGTYLEIYIGIIVTCIVCQIVAIVAAEYTFRKLEFKEKKQRLSENKYYLLLSLKHGIFRSLIYFIKENWKRSKVVVASVLLKIVSLTAGVGLLGVGFTLLGDEFINNSSLKHIFYKLQFYNYYFYDILVGLAAASVVLGTLTSTVAILGLVGSWKKSPILLVMSSALSLVLNIPRTIAVAFWIFFIAKINGGMKFQLSLQQFGYLKYGFVNEITTKWNDMIMTLQCCGVNDNNETLIMQGIQFCCKNAHPGILDSDEQYPISNSIFDYFGGCGGYKTETCADKILSKTELFVGWFLAIVLLQIVFEIIGVVIVNKEYSVILLTNRSEKSTKEDLNSKSALIRKMFRGLKSFCLINWKRSKLTLVLLISLGSLFILNLVVLCLAINIRYDKVFGNTDIQVLFSRINVTDHTLTTAVNTFSIVTVTFSSLSIAVVIFSFIVMSLPKWKSVLSFVSAGLLCTVAVGNLLQEGLWVAYFINVSSELENELTKQFISYGGGYYRSDDSAVNVGYLSLSWNTLFVKAECCGVGPMILSSFNATPWKPTTLMSGHIIPVQCCISQTDVFPYSSREDSNCTTSVLDGTYHLQACDVAIKKRLEIYSTIFIVFMSIIILAEICSVVTTVLNARCYKQDATLLILSIQSSGEDDEIRKDDKTPKVKDNVKKKRKHGDKKGKGSSRNKRKRSVGTVDIQQNANIIVQENAEENIELHMMKSMETEETIDDKPDKHTDKRRLEEDELAEKDLTMPDN